MFWKLFAFVVFVLISIWMVAVQAAPAHAADKRIECVGVVTFWPVHDFHDPELRNGTASLVSDTKQDEDCSTRLVGKQLAKLVKTCDLNDHCRVIGIVGPNGWVRIDRVVAMSPIFGIPLTHANVSLPQKMIGQWCAMSKDSNEYERRTCSEEETSRNATMTLSKHSVVYFEDGCDFTEVQKRDRNVYYVHGDCSGEERSWKDTMTFQLLPNGHILVRVITHSKEKSDEGRNVK